MQRRDRVPSDLAGSGFRDRSPRPGKSNVNRDQETTLSLRSSPGVKPSVTRVIIGIMDRTRPKSRRIPDVIRRNCRSTLSAIAGIRRPIDRRLAEPPGRAPLSPVTSRMFRIQSQIVPASVSRSGGGRRRPPAIDRRRTVPRLQPLRNVAVFKSISVGFKTGVSSVTATSISSIQRPLPVRGRVRIGPGADRSITGVTAVYCGGRT